jgi:hypothetical protein
MTTLHFDGFDDYATKSNSVTGIQGGGWIVAGNTQGGCTVGGRNSDFTAMALRCLEFANPTSSFTQDERDLGTNYTSLGGGLAIYANVIPRDWYNATLKGERIMAWYDSARVYQCELVMDWFGRFHFCRGSTILASSTLSNPAHRLREGRWGALDWEITFSQTVGTFELWLNDVKIIDATGLDNCDTANANCRYVRLSISNGLDSTLYVDDWYITDGARLEHPFVLSLKPNNDGGVNVWTASSGTDEFAMVDDPTPDTDTTYNQASTAGDESRHGCENLPSYVTEVLSVGAHALLRKTDATARTARVLLNSNGTESLGNTHTLTTTYGGSWINALDTDPDTAAAWTLSGVNALEVGYEVVS